MQELISRGKWNYPLHTIKVNEFVKLGKEEKEKQIKLRIEALENLLVKKKMDIKIVCSGSSEKNIRYLNRIIKTVRGEETATNFVVEMYETILDVRGDSESVHKEIYKAFEGAVPISSIRRILSQYRRGKLG